MAQKTCYVKCASNEQAQKLRPELVKVGFVDDEVWNNRKKLKDCFCYVIYGDIKDGEDPMTFCMFDERIANRLPLLYTLTPDENLTEAAEKIKELFDNQ